MSSSKLILRIKANNSNLQNNKKEGEGLKKMKTNKIRCKMSKMLLKIKTCIFHSKITSMKTQKIIKIAFIKIT